MRIIIAGSRDFNDYELLLITADNIICDFMCRLNTNDVEIISGMARGADTLALRFAKESNKPVRKFPADWNLYGKRAGYIRNEQMAKYASEDKEVGVLIAYWDGESKGTKHMIDLARKHGLKVNIINYKEG